MLRVPTSRLAWRPHQLQAAAQRSISSLHPRPAVRLSPSHLRCASSISTLRLSPPSASPFAPRRLFSSVVDSSWLNGTNASASPSLTPLSDHPSPLQLTLLPHHLPHALLSPPVPVSFLSFSPYVDEMYLAWKDDPSSVHKSWDAYFKTGTYTAPPGLYEDYSSITRTPSPSSPSPTPSHSPSASPSTSPSSSRVDPAKIVQLVRAFQVRGHLMANLDPLGILPPRPDHEHLDIATYGLGEKDLDSQVDLSQLTADVKGFLERGRPGVTLRQILTRLKETYCGTIGYEYMHIASIEKCNWIREKIETRERMVFTKQAKLQVLDRLTWADHFERYIQKSAPHTTNTRLRTVGTSFAPINRVSTSRSLAGALSCVSV